MVLTMVGIYGVAASAASQCIRELGIRVASGAKSMDIVPFIVAGGAKPV